MCLIVFGLNSHPRYELIMVANRDEFFDRETQNAHYWSGPAHILAGKDLRSGGTWIGVDKSGRLAAVTNFRDFRNLKDEAPSRGQLPIRFLNGNLPAKDFLNSIAKESEQYNGFNLLLKDQSGFFHFSNISKKTSELKEGVHGLSNALMNSPWPKVRKAKEKLSEALSTQDVENTYLAGLLYDMQLAKDEELLDTGAPLELEKNLSSMFIKIPGYGTRCTTVVKIGVDKAAEFTEIVYNNAGNTVETQTFQFQIQ